MHTHTNTHTHSPGSQPVPSARSVPRSLISPHPVPPAQRTHPRILSLTRSTHAWQHMSTLCTCASLLMLFIFAELLGDEAVTRMGSDTHQTRYVPQPAPPAPLLSIRATSAALAQWQRLWHMSQSFKCLFFSWGWLGEPAREEMTFCVLRRGGGLVVAPSSCLLWLSLALSCEHITTWTNKPCHLETPALVTMLSGSTTGAVHRHSLIGPSRRTHTHTHTVEHTVCF